MSKFGHQFITQKTLLMVLAGISNLNTVQLKKLKSLDIRANKMRACPVPLICREIENAYVWWLKGVNLAGSTCNLFQTRAMF